MSTSPSVGGGQSLTATLSLAEGRVPEPLRAVLRGVGQVFFQGSALTGICFLLGILASSPLMALGGLVGSVIGTAVARLAKWDAGETADGIYGFNATLVGIATFVFFQPGAASVALLVAGCVVATLVTWISRRKLPFPTYTAPFVVTTWVLWLIGTAMGIATVAPGAPITEANAFVTVANGIGQVMFQANVITGLLFVIGIALCNWRHAAWVVAGSVIGMLFATYHSTTLPPGVVVEGVVSRYPAPNIYFGLYGYNATLVAVALYMWRPSLIPALLGILLSVPVTELLPLTGLPALTGPFVLATWIVLLFGWLDAKCSRRTPPASG